MSSSRLERIGTIYSRMQGLMQRGVVKVDDRPVWFDVYRAFPPMEEPIFARPPPTTPLKQIFYKEDALRARFHSAGLGTSGYRLAANAGMGGQGGTRKYLQQYQSLATDNESASEDELIAKAATIIGEHFKEAGESRERREVSEIREMQDPDDPPQREKSVSSQVVDESKIVTNIKDIFDRN